MQPTQLSSYKSLLSKCSQTKLVLPLSLNSFPLAIIGESLGKDEDKEEQYFVGKSGKLLDKLLKETGIPRYTCHISNVIKVLIPPKVKKEQYLNSIGLSTESFMPYLIEELQTVQPKAILAVGAIAMKALTGEDGILKKRGSVLECNLLDNPIPVIPTLHPSFLFRGNMKLYPIVRHDIKRFAETGYGISKPAEDYNMIIDPTLTQCLEFLYDIQNNASATCFDIETVARQNITCIGWTKDRKNAICIPFRYQGLKNRWPKHDQILLIRAMQEVYNKPGLTKIGQNIHYDMHYLRPLLGFPREPIFDTMYAHDLINPDSKHDLGFLTSIYTKMPYHKDEAKDWMQKDLPHDNILWEYNIKDVITTHRIYEKLRQDLKEEGLYDMFTGYVMPFRRVLFEMETKGIRINKELKDEWTQFVEEEELPIALDILEKLVGSPINPNSSKQVGEFLTSLGIPVQRTDKGNFSVNEEKLDAIKARFPQHKTILEQLVCTRKLKAKSLGTYLKSKVSEDGRMRTSYGTTVTGRLSSKANHEGLGSNLQNQPKEFRQMFIPDKDQTFLEPDLSQAEALVMAYLMGAEELKKRMQSGEKIHNIVGEWIYDKSYKKLTPKEYLISKRTVHGSNYALGERKFATVIDKTVGEAKQIRAKYARVVPELPNYHKRIRETVDRERRITTPYGRRRLFTGFINDDVYRSAYAQTPQSTVVDTINTGILGLWLIKPKDIYLAAQVHDSILISLPKEKVNWFSKYIKAHLETLREIEIEGEILVIPCDVGKTKQDWYGK